LSESKSMSKSLIDFLDTALSNLARIELGKDRINLENIVRDTIAYERVDNDTIAVITRHGLKIVISKYGVSVFNIENKAIDLSRLERELNRVYDMVNHVHDRLLKIHNPEKIDLYHELLTLQETMNTINTIFNILHNWV